MQIKTKKKTWIWRPNFFGRLDLFHDQQQENLMKRQLCILSASRRENLSQCLGYGEDLSRAPTLTFHENCGI